ncbi:hypothetical protein LIN78_01915 [Leeia sp. TBRC 13508]|uniref:Phage tail assembly protein n=1 Tax=Leeia speluncae TaxID=2884804 RepID=A0ABS8D285_9NEIS|nr:hypothetical protein [Leeia speluncae]MCB6182311.1 hypothetical protein [Leeia speluncae]
MIKEEGKLPIGIEFEGKTHTAFTIRPAKMRDNVEAVEELGGDASLNRLSAAVLARQILSLGEIPKDKITSDLILDLDEEDWLELEAAKGRLAKKRQPLKSDSESNASL